MNTDQPLPNELLLMIVARVKSDRKALHTLLFISRFFFMAAAPLLYANFLCADLFKKNEQKRQSKLIELLIASAIHSQRRLSHGEASNSPNGAFSATQFLEGFGLQLVEPVTSSLLQDAIMGTSPTTIDYGLYLKTQLSISIDSHIQRLLTALDLPIDEQQPATVFELIDVWDEQEHRDCLCERHGVHRRLSILFLQCYPEHITSIEFCVCKAHQFLQLADKLPSLAELTVRRRPAFYIPESHLQNTIAFIFKNRTAFPKKRPLQLRFTSWEWQSWHPSYHVGDFYDDSWEDDHLTGQERRELDRQYQLPRVALYKAAGHPVEMDLSLCPDFYQDAIDDIEVDALERLVDLNRSRFEFGEDPERQAFLQRCQRLKALEIYVDHPEFFSWAVNWNQSGTTPQPETPFNKLRELTLHTCGRYGALEDAMTAFGRTVDTVCFYDHGAHENDQEELSIHVRVGSWNLPSVRVIDISGYCGLGDFSECPLLEKLKVRLFQPSNLDPTDEDDESQDLIAVAPVWNLPCLKTLELYGMAALLFDYNTLGLVPRLESLHLTSDLHVPVDMTQRLPHYNQRLAFPESHDMPTSPIVEHVWKKQWNLPRLQSLILEGPPSSVFCFCWLTGCPMLNTLLLDTRQARQRLPLLSSSKSSAILPEIPPHDRTHTFDEDLGSGLCPEAKPLLCSNLETLTLKGNWEMSQEALVRALVIYVPNLSKLQVERLIMGPPKNKSFRHASWLIHAVFRAEDIMKSWRHCDESDGSALKPMSSPECVPKRNKLLWIESPYSLGSDDLDDLGLTCAMMEMLERYKAGSKQVFLMGDKLYVRKEDAF